MRFESFFVMLSSLAELSKAYEDIRIRYKAPCAAEHSPGHTCTSPTHERKYGVADLKIVSDKTHCIACSPRTVELRETEQECGYVLAIEVVLC